MELNVGKLQMLAKIPVLFSSLLSPLVHLPWPQRLLFLSSLGFYPSHNLISSVSLPASGNDILDGYFSNYFPGFSLHFLLPKLRAQQVLFADFFLNCFSL